MSNIFINWLRKVGSTGAMNLIIVLFLSAGTSFVTGCENETELDFIADFSYAFIDNNHVLFTNKSEGEYYSLFWDFGNGDTLSTSDKSKNPEVYYPLAGDYQVQLVLYNYTGQRQSITKIVSIPSDDLVISFHAEMDPDDSNYVNLENTSTGNYDSFKWIYRNREVENENDFRAYFPFEGSHRIELQVTKGTNTFSSERMVTIPGDDPFYVDKLTLSWQDDFDGDAVNPDHWTFETGAGGWGNNELQNYTDGSNAEVADGKLIITARKVDENKQPGSYTSSRIITMNKKEFTYGRMEIRAKLPSGTGIWPAIWMLGSNFTTAGWPACGEIDIMEYVGYQPNTVHATLHTPSSYGNSINSATITLESCEEDFHNYGMIWTEKYIRFYIDTPDHTIYAYAPATKNDQNWPFDQPFFFILNVAVGGTWGGANGIDNTIFPQAMEVDYVRVYQETP